MTFCDLLYRGTFFDRMDIGPGGPSKIITTNSNTLFVEVLNINGQLVCSYQSVRSTSLADMKVDGDGAIYMTKSYDRQ